MTFSNSIFSSVASEKRWIEEMCNNFRVVEMCTTFPRQHVVNVNPDTPCCVFRTPKSLSETKPETYAPQKLGLGPYHHLRPDLYTMQRKKLAAVIKFLNADKLPNIQLVVEDLLQREYIVRSSYDEYLDLDPLTLAWILAIDAIYLIQFLKNHFEDLFAESGTEKAGEILMLENQIPVVFLLEVRRILNLSSGDNDDREFCKDLRKFCEEESPLEFDECPIDILSVMKQGNPLMVMYDLIVSNRGGELEEVFVEKSCEFSVDEIDMGFSLFDDVTESVEIASSLGLIPRGVEKHVSFIKKVPWPRILALFKKGNPDEEQSKLVEEIDIPSVSQLNEFAGIEFELTDGGIRDVEFDEREKKFYLPLITLKPNSEVILRNLIAYEAAVAKPGSTLELAEYVDLMCGIVDTTNDVEILCNAGIIKSDLKNEEVARIFNGIKKSTGDKEEKTTNIEKAVEKVNEQYDNTTRVKVARFIRKYVYRSWKFLTFFSTVVVILLLILQAFCEIYGCSKRWFVK